MMINCHAYCATNYHSILTHNHKNRHDINYYYYYCSRKYEIDKKKNTKPYKQHHLCVTLTVFENNHIPYKLYT